MRSKNIRTCSSIIFLNQEINLTTTSNPESKSQPIIKEHEHQNYKKKKKHEDHQIKEHEQEQTQENPHETTPKPNHPKNRNPAVWANFALCSNYVRGRARPNIPCERRLTSEDVLPRNVQNYRSRRGGACL